MPYITKFHTNLNACIGLHLGLESDSYETDFVSKILNKIDVIEGSSTFLEK